MRPDRCAVAAEMHGSEVRNVRIGGDQVEPLSLLAIYRAEEDELLEETTGYVPPLVAAPRHLRRRALREEIPDELLVPDAEPLPTGLKRATSAKRAAAADLDAGEAAYRRKRLVALLSVFVVAFSVPALVIALVLAG